MRQGFVTVIYKQRKNGFGLLGFGMFTYSCSDFCNAAPSSQMKAISSQLFPHPLSPHCSVSAAFTCMDGLCYGTAAWPHSSVGAVTAKWSESYELHDLN